MYLGVGVRVADSPAVAGVDVRHSLGARGHRPHLAQLVGSFGGSDPAARGGLERCLDMFNGNGLFPLFRFGECFHASQIANTQIDHH